MSKQHHTFLHLNHLISLSIHVQSKRVQYEKAIFSFNAKNFIKEKVMNQSKRNLDAIYRFWNFEQFVQIAEDVEFLLQYIRCFLWLFHRTLLTLSSISVLAL